MTTIFLPMMILLQLPRAKRNFWVGMTELCRAPKPATDLGHSLWSREFAPPLSPCVSETIAIYLCQAKTSRLPSCHGARAPAQTG